jgi:hypothetical protein
MNIHHAPHHGASTEWETPPEILAALGQFDDDPARAGLTDGLTRAWRGLVWLNPPYGPEIGQWLAKLAEHGSGVALIFARTETRWFVEFVWNFASALLFLHGRPHFYRDGVRAKGNSGGPLVLVSYGIEAQRRLEKCGLLGTLITDWNRP